MFQTVKFKFAINAPIAIREINPKLGPSFQTWTKIKAIEDGKVILQNKEVVILRVLPTNFKLKSMLEQKAILYEYQNFLKNINSQMQILISSQKTDVSNHLNQVYKFTKENPSISVMSKDYINLVNKIVSEKNTITKTFYIILDSNPNIQNDILKISECLMNCGNEVEMCTKEDIKKLITNYTNKRLQNLML